MAASLGPWYVGGRDSSSCPLFDGEMLAVEMGLGFVDVCLFRVTSWVSGDGGCGAGAGALRGSVVPFGAAVGGCVARFGGVFPPGARTPCDTVFALGVGDWILGACLGRGAGTGAGSASDSESEESEESEDEPDDDSSFSSRNSNTLGDCFVGSGFGGSGDFRAEFAPWACCDGELFSVVLELAIGPACAFEMLETNE